MKTCTSKENSKYCDCDCARCADHKELNVNNLERDLDDAFIMAEHIERKGYSFF